MNRKLFGFLTGWQFTVLAGIAMIVPGMLAAAVTFQPVAILDPNTGVKALVDNARRLYVNDPIAGYANTPGNFVDIEFSASGRAGGLCNGPAYTVPAGKALVIRSISGGLTNILSTGTRAEFFLSKNSNCSENVASVFTGIPGGQEGPLNISLGLGAAVPAGTTLRVYTINAQGQGFIHGYLVPAGAVPAAGTAESIALNPVVSAKPQR